MDIKSLEEHVKKVRHLMTRSVVEREEFSSFEKIKKNHQKKFRGKIPGTHNLIFFAHL